MKRIDPRLFNELRRTSSSIAVGWLLERTDGFTLGFTSSDIEFERDGVVYKPTNAFSGTAAVSKNNLSVDNMSAVALISDEITEKDLKAGLYDNAMVKVFWISPTNPGWGTVPIRGGTFGEVVIRNSQFEVELRAAMQLLQQPFGENYTLECGAHLGDDKCKVQIEGVPKWTPETKYISKADSDAGIGSLVEPPIANGFWYRCVRAGVRETPAVVNNPWAGPLHGFMGLYPDHTIQASGAPDFTAQHSALTNDAAERYAAADAAGIKPLPGSLAYEMQYNATYGLYGAQKADNVTIEGYTNPTQSFYHISSETSGVLVDSKMFLKPTKQYAAPLSSAPGVQPLTVTNGQVKITYAIGMSAVTEPVWPTVPGATVEDGTVTWSAVYARTVYDGYVAAVYSRGKFEDNGSKRFEPTGHYKYGRLTWLTGKNAGLSNEVREHLNAATGMPLGAGATITLLEVSPFEIEVGDTYKITVGCAKNRLACKRWDNLNNFRGFPDMPTEDKALATPNFSQQGTQGKPDKGGS